MQIVIPAKSDGNEALNAFALGILNLVRRPIAPLFLPAIGPLIGFFTAHPLALTNFIQAYDRILALVWLGPPPPVVPAAVLALLNANLLLNPAVTYTTVQEKLARALRILARDLLQNNKSGRRLLYQAFKHSFLRYCAKQFGITISEQDYAKSMNVGINNVYIFDKLFSAQNTFGTIFTNLLEVSPTNLQQLEYLLNQPTIVGALRQDWNGLGGPNIEAKYLHMLTNNLSGIGEIELKLLAESFAINLKVRRGEKSKSLTDKNFPHTIVLHNELVFQKATEPSTSWSAVLSRVSIANLPNYDWYIRIRRCYQFLDNIFDERIENLGYGNEFQPDNTAGYIDFSAKKKFFQKFREKFTDEQSQIYGWRGLATWVATKDIEVRNSKRADGLNHTMEEFWILSKILEGCPAVKDFAERTSISHFALSNFNANDVTLLQQLAGPATPIVGVLVGALTPANFKITPFTIANINAIRTVLGTILPPDNLIANRLSNKIVLKNNDLIDVTRANFTYRTQKDLVKKRYTYARYIEYAGNPSKFLMLFHLDIQDPNPSMQKKVRSKLALYDKDCKFERTCCLCFRPWIVCCGACCKERKVADCNLYTYEGWSVRNCCNLVWLAFLGIILSIPLILAITLPRGLYRLANEPDNSGKKTAYDILNPFVATFLSILIGSYLIFAINKGHNNIHNLYHDRDERHEYHKDMAKILYATKLYNIVERFELKVDRDVLNNINRLKGLFGVLGRPLAGVNLNILDKITALPYERLEELRRKKRCKLHLPPKDKERKQLERFIQLTKILSEQPLLPFQQAELLQLAYPLLASLYSRKPFEGPYVNSAIEKVIINHINEATKAEKNPIEDITQNTGENLQFQRIRRSYIKWDAGVRIKEEIKKKQIKEFYRHYGLFKEDDRVKNNITRPTDCYSFDDCYDLNSNIEINQQLSFNAADIPKL